MNPSLLRTCVAAALLASAAAAQSPTFSGWRSDLHLWTEISGTAQSLEPGRLNGDTRMDALLRTNDTLAVVIGPGLFESYSTFADSPTGATVVAGSTQDSVAAATSSGLSLWSWSSSAGAMVETVLSTSASWQNAVELQSLPHTSGQAIVGLSADRTSIVRGVWTGSSWTAESTINVDVVVRSWSLLDFTTGSGHEYATVSANGFTVFDNAGNEVATPLAEFGGGEQLYRVPGATAGKDVVAYIFPFSGYWYLSVVSLQSSPTIAYVAEPAQFIGGPVADAQIADWDLDGKADLVITSANTPETWILHRERVANSPWLFQADPASVYHVPHSPDEDGPSHMLTKTALADFDFDGDVDLLGVSQVEGASGLSLFRNTPRNENARRPRLNVSSSCTNDPSGLCMMTPIIDLDTDEVIAMQFDLDLYNPAPLASGAAATHLEFLCYLQDEFQPFYPSATLFVDTAPTLDTHLSIPGGSPSTSVYTVTVNVAGRYDPALAYNFAISAIRKVNGVIVERGPATVSVLSETTFVPPQSGPQPFSPEFIRFGDGPIGLPEGGNDRPVIRPPGGSPSGGG